MTTDSAELVGSARQYFETLWDAAGKCLSPDMITKWQQDLWGAPHGGDGSNKPRLHDYGAGVGIDPDTRSVDLTTPFEDATQYFVKLFGESSNREPLELLVIEEIKRSGCHWACTYPKGKRPRQVQDSAVLFMARLVHGSDIRVFGRAIGRAYRGVADDATEGDIKLRDWKKKWPHYIRVRGSEFVGGTLGDGVSLNELMRELGANSFAPTARHLAAGMGNIDPRHAYLQKPAVELTPRAAQWLNSRLAAAMEAHGRIGAESLNFP